MSRIGLAALILGASLAALPAVRTVRLESRGGRGLSPHRQNLTLAPPLTEVPGIGYPGR